MKFYSPVGRGASLLKAQGSISRIQSNQETYDMSDETKPTIDRRINNLRAIADDESVNNFARSICSEASNYLAAIEAQAVPDMNTQTPRTENFEKLLDHCYPHGFDQATSTWHSWPDFARTLELENAELKRQLSEAQKVLLWSRQKLTLYQSESSGEYIGGMEYTELIRHIAAAIKEQK